jgi:WD40 repeat protein
MLLFCFGAARFVEAQAPEQSPPRLSVQKGHEESVYRMAFSADGRTLASSSLDKSVRLWDVEKGWELGVLDAEDEMLSDLVFSGDGRRLVGYKNSVIIWDVATGRKLHSYAPGLLMGLEQYLVSFDGRRLLVVRETNAVEVLEAETGRVLKTLLRGEQRRLDEVTRRVAAAPDWKTFFVYGEGGLVRALDASSGATRFSFKASPRRLSLSLDGALLAFADEATRALVVSDAATGRELWRKPDANSPWLTFDASGKQLIAFHETGVAAFDARTGQEAGKWPGVRSNPADNKFERELSFLPLPDGSGYAFNPPNPRNIEIDILNRDSRVLRTLAGRASTIADVAFSPDGRTLVLAPNDHVSGDSREDDAVFLLNYADGTQGRALIQPKGGVMHLAYSPDGKRLATAGLTSLTLWDLEKGGVLSELESSVSYGNLAFSPDGKLLASFNYKNLTLWDTSSGQVVRQLSENKETVHFVAFSPDGRLLVAVNNVRKEVVLWDVATGQPARTIPQVSGTLAFSPGGKVFAANDPEGHVIFVDPTTGATVSRVAAAPARASARQMLVGHFRLTYSPDGKRLAAVAIVLNPQGKVRLQMQGSPQRADVFIRLWDTATGAELRTLDGHSEFIMSLAFSGDGRYLLSGGQDRLAKLWEVESGRELASLTPVGRDDWIVMTPDGLFDGSPAAWSAILWRFSDTLRDAAPVEAFFNEYYYPNLLTELLRGKHPSAPGGGLAARDRRSARLDLNLSGASADTDVLAAREVKVRLDVSDAPAGAKDVRLFRNGSLVRVWRGDVLKGAPRVTLEATLPIVAGENHLTAYAFNRDNVKSPDARLNLNGADSLRRKGVIYMLAIGLNEYENANFNLKYAVADARSFASAFIRQQSQLGRYAGVKPVGLLDRNATKANIMRALAGLARQVQPEDAVVVYFAGHGMAYQNQFYLLPHDLGYAGGRNQLDDAGLQLMLSRSVSDRELETAFEGVDAGSFLLVIDACNSGQALEAEEGRRGPMNAKGLAQLAYEKGMYVLTAAQSFQAAQEVSKLGHGLLTYVLIEEGLTQKAADAAPKDGRILLREWLDFTTRRVPEMQLDEIERSIERGGDLSFADEVRGLSVRKKPQQRVSQRPRVFYRRESEAAPLVVSRQ